MASTVEFGWLVDFRWDHPLLRQTTPPGAVHRRVMIFYLYSMPLACPSTLLRDQSRVLDQLLSVPNNDSVRKKNLPTNNVRLAGPQSCSLVHSVLAAVRDALNCVVVLKAVCLGC